MHDVDQIAIRTDDDGIRQALPDQDFNAARMAVNGGSHGDAAFKDTQ